MTKQNSNSEVCRERLWSISPLTVTYIDRNQLENVVVLGKGMQVAFL